MTTERLAATTLAALAPMLIADLATAQSHPEKPAWVYEKCYAVAKAGRNDCFSARHSCAGTAEQDSDPLAWVYLPQGTCLKIVGGKLTPT